jgi:hypothetical protein
MRIPVFCRSIGLSVAVSLIVTATASAHPTVTMSVRATSISHSADGSSLVPVSLEARYKIQGSEVDGQLPSPLAHINLSFPKGIKLNTHGFDTCPAQAFRPSLPLGPSVCPKRARAGGAGSIQTAMLLRGGPLVEHGTLKAFFLRGGRLGFWLQASVPVAIKVRYATGSFSLAHSPFGTKLLANVEPLTTLPTAPDAATTAITVELGASYKRGRQTVSFISLRRKCSGADLSLVSQLVFQNGEKASVAARGKCREV